MGLMPLLLWTKRGHEYSHNHKGWILTVYENATGDWTWKADNYDNGNRCIHEVWGEKPTRDEAMNAAVRWAGGKR